MEKRNKLMAIVVLGVMVIAAATVSAMPLGVQNELLPEHQAAIDALTTRYDTNTGLPTLYNLVIEYGSVSADRDGRVKYKMVLEGSDFYPFPVRFTITPAKVGNNGEIVYFEGKWPSSPNGNGGAGGNGGGDNGGGDNGGGGDDETPEAPVADFIGDPLSGAAPLDVEFTDLSTGDITSRLFDFGDGTNDTAVVGHTYTDPGVYTVSLTVTGPGGCDTMTKIEYISVEEPFIENIDISFVADGGGCLLLGGGGWPPPTYYKMVVTADTNLADGTEIDVDVDGKFWGWQDVTDGTASASGGEIVWESGADFKTSGLEYKYRVTLSGGGVSGTGYETDNYKWWSW